MIFDEPGVDTMFTDLRHSVRVLVKKPGFSALIIVVLSVGIGTTSTIFSIVDAVLLKPLPFREPDRLVSITGVVGNEEEDNVSLPDLQDWRAQTKAFSDLAGYATASVTLTGRGPAASLQVTGTTSDLFTMLGATPLRGRTLTPDDDRKKAPVAGS